MLDRKFFIENAANIVARYRKHIFDPAGGGSAAKQVDNKPYPSYTSKYSIAKKSTKIKTYHKLSLFFRLQKKIKIKGKSKEKYLRSK